jgi:serine protease
MYVPIRVVATVLACAMLAACGVNGTSMSSVQQAPSAQHGASQQTVSRYTLSGTHIMLPRGSALPNAGLQLLYGGGSIEKYPIIYVVFWHFATDPTGEATYLTNFLNGIGGSSWINTDTQYYESSRGNITNPTGQLGGTWSDTAFIPRHPTDSAIQGEAKRLIKHFGYNRDAMYIVATAHGHNTSGFGKQFCAYHGATSTTSGEAAYTNLPYITDAGASCGQNIVNPGPSGVNDGVSIVAGHEEAEGQTDPVPPSGWVDSQGAEIGDKCAWQGLANIILSTGTFAVQPLWSNASSGCVLSYP